MNRYLAKIKDQTYYRMRYYYRRFKVKRSLKQISPDHLQLILKSCSPKEREFFKKELNLE